MLHIRVARPLWRDDIRSRARRRELVAHRQSCRLGKASAAAPGGTGLARLGVFEEPKKAGVSGAGERAAGSEAEKGVGHTSPGFYPKFIKKQWKGF